MEPVLQLALDFVDLKRALKNAEAAAAGGADWLEAGTPLAYAPRRRRRGNQPVCNPNAGCGDPGRTGMPGMTPLVSRSETPVGAGV